MKHIRVVSLFVTKPSRFTNHFRHTFRPPMSILGKCFSFNFITYSIKLKYILFEFFEVLLINFLEYFSFDVYLFIRKNIRWPTIRAIHIRWFRTNLSYDNLCWFIPFNSLDYFKVCDATIVLMWFFTQLGTHTICSPIKRPSDVNDINTCIKVVMK
jgi:hypothetical protein